MRNGIGLHRGKSVEIAIWIYGGLVEIDGRCFIVAGERYNPVTKEFEDTFIEGHNIIYGVVHQEVVPETVCEYTGKDSKTGKKIFEKDACEFYHGYTVNTNKAIVKYIGDTDCICNPKSGTAFVFENIGLLGSHVTVGECTVKDVLGNIIDNPELEKNDGRKRRN